LTKGKKTKKGIFERHLQELHKKKNHQPLLFALKEKKEITTARGVGGKEDRACSCYVGNGKGTDKSQRF